MTATTTSDGHRAPVRHGSVKAKKQQPSWLVDSCTTNESLAIDARHPIIVVNPEVTAAVPYSSGRCGVFGSPSRTARGVPSYGGTAILQAYSQLSDLPYFHDYKAHLKHSDFLKHSRCAS